MQTIGEQRVRIDFNVNNLSTVQQIKEQAAILINMINSLPIPEDQEKTSEYIRLRILAMTAFEEGAMWGVKAATI